MQDINLLRSKLNVVINPLSKDGKWTRINNVRSLKSQAKSYQTRIEEFIIECEEQETKLIGERE